MAQIVIPCRDLDVGITAFVEQFGFRLDLIMPADDPSVAVLSGCGVEVRLVVGDGVPDVDPSVVPDLVTRYEVTRAGDGRPGRAGMRYRDLLPSRQGGRFIASHITIPDGGPVPDYVHAHDVRLQVIACLRGWVRVVYEDQGPPFVLAAGECVVQPPGIRHRVLECGAGLEVLEVTCPAVHATHVDHTIELPTAERRPARRFGGQRFVHAPIGDPAIGAATDELVGVRRVVAEQLGAGAVRHDGELVLWYVVAGRLAVRVDGDDGVTLDAGDAVAIPRGAPFAAEAVTPGIDVVEVTVPAQPRVEVG